MQLTSQQEIRILHVDDDPSITDLTGTFLEREDDRFTIETATSADEGLQRISDLPPDCIVSDYNMPGMNGIEFLQTVREEHPDLPFILFTGKGSETVASDAISADVTDYLQKGSGTEQYELLANRIRNAVHARRETRRADRQEQLMRLTEFAGETGGFEIDVDSGDLLLTDGTRRLIGLSDDTQITLEEAIELYHPDDQADVRQTVTQAAETGEETRGTWRLQTLDGDERLVDVTMVPATENDDITTLRGAIHDVTERRKRRRELEQIETLFQHAQDSLFLIDVAEEFTVERVNPAYEKATGLSADRLHGRTPREILGEQQGATVERRYRDCVEHEKPLDYTEQLRFDGDLRQWETRIAPVVLDESVEYIVGATRDVTDREERQRELGRLQQAIDDANVSITLADPSQQDEPLVYVNNAFEEMTGYPPEETLGRNCRFLQGEDTDSETVAALREAIDNEEQISIELRNYRKDGTEFWNRLTVTPIYNDDDELVRYLGTQEDVTERKERERELRAERRFIEQALDALDELFYVLDTDGTLQRWNSQIPELTGYTDDDLTGMQVVELFPEDERENIADGIATTLADGQAKVEADLRTTGGERLPCEFTGAQLTDEDGTVTGIVGVGRDLTERRQRERELERQNDLFTKAQDIADVGAWAHDTESRTLTWTDHVYEMHDVSKEFDPSFEEVAQLYHPDDRPKLREAADQAVTAGKPYDLEVRMTAKDDGIRWIRTVADPQTENGEVVRVRGAVHDITDQKQREQEIRNLKRQYQTLLENFPNGAVYLIDKDLKYIRARGTELRRVGLSPASIEGKTPHDLLPEQIADEACHYYEQALEGTASTFEQEYRGQRYRIQTVPVRYDGEEITHLMAVAQNITEYTEDKRELERKNKRLEEFASIVSHDLRNPLTVAEGHLELAAETCESDHLARATDAIDRSQALIDDLLALAREGDRVDETEPVELTTVAENSWQTVETQQATLDADESGVIEADRSRIQQLLENLYRNAIEHGGDDVTVSVGAIDDGFYVADTGSGIPESDREDVFEAGYSTNEDGTGFGLQIVKQIADTHGWEVEITESEDGGARFKITGVEKGA